MGLLKPGEHVGVVIVTYNSERHVEALLDSLPAALGDIEAKTVVVDNGSIDKTRLLLAARKDCTVVAAPNRGYSAGINLGMTSTSDAAAWLILNPDITLDARAVAAMLDGFADPRVGIVGPRVLDPSGVLQPSMRREPSLRRALGLSFTGWPSLSEHVGEPGAYLVAADSDWLMGAALIVSRGCALDVGRWDESFFLYSEETDYCLRARDLGWKVRYVPSAVVRHAGGGSGRSGRTHAMQVLNRVRLYRRRHSVLASIAYYLLSIMSEVSWVMRGAPWSRTSLLALILPSRRPEELGLARGLIPK